MLSLPSQTILFSVPNTFLGNLIFNSPALPLILNPAYYLLLFANAFPLHSRRVLYDTRRELRFSIRFTFPSNARGLMKPVQHKKY